MCSCCSRNNSTSSGGRKGSDGFLGYFAQFVSSTASSPGAVHMVQSAQYLDYGVRGSITDRSNAILICAKRPHRVGPTQPPIQWLTVTLFPGVHRPGRKADNFTVPRLRMCGGIPLLPPYAFISTFAVYVTTYCGSNASHTREMPELFTHQLDTASQRVTRGQRINSFNPGPLTSYPIFRPLLQCLPANAETAQ